jgi:hypothetical protein
MASHIGRRKFLATLGGAAAWPLTARAQQGERMRRIGVLNPFAESDPEVQANVTAFRQALQKLGWTEGQSRLRLRPDIKALYCFHQNNDDSKCEVAHTSLRFPALKSGTPKFRIGTGRRLQCDAQSYALPRGSPRWR